MFLLSDPLGLMVLQDGKSFTFLSLPTYAHDAGRQAALYVSVINIAHEEPNIWFLAAWNFIQLCERKYNTFMFTAM